MAIVQTMTTSFKAELFTGTQVFGTDTFKLALYTSAADLGAATTVYSSTNEVAASGSYVAGGGALTGVTVASSGTTAWVTFDNISFTSATITARGALIYNFSKGNKSVAVLDFGQDKSSSSSTFTVQFPVADATNAIIRIS
jgi:hypothetical protein